MKHFFQTDRKKSRGIFFGWWTVITGTFLNFLGSGYSDYGFSALFKPMSEELQLSRATTSLASSIGRFGGGLEALVVGWFVDRFGPKKIAIFGLFLFCSALVLTYYMDSLWSFIVVWGIMAGMGGTLCWTTPMEKAITNWFVKKRGLAMGIRWVLSGMLLLPLITWLIDTQGWRMTCAIGGVVMFAVGLPLILLFVRDHRPEYYGLLPDGAKAEDDAESSEGMMERGAEYAEEVQEVEFTLRQAMKTPSYWMIVLAQATFGSTHRALSLHIMPFLTDMNIEATSAAAMVTLTGLISLALRFIGGVAADRIRIGYLRFFFGGSYLLKAVALTIIVINQSTPAIYVFLTLNYISFGISMTLGSFIWGRYFGRKAFGSIRGFSAVFMMPLAFLVPIYAGWVYDTSGSYLNAFITLAILAAAAGVFMFFAPPPKPPAQVTDINKFL
ncbi:MAG: MFS transporter [Dehalococcoidales bacterium]|nr:MAG: MFS transporter [Dehalococcoidales bacterium]